jgi:hypothetical protein
MDTKGSENMKWWKKIKKTPSKEYMKYEDGKIIPVKVEEYGRYREYNSFHKETDMDIKNAAQTKTDISPKLTNHNKTQILKWIGAIAVTIFFIYTIKDVYVAFMYPEKPPITERASNNQTDTSTSDSQMDNDKPSKSSILSGIYKVDSKVMDKFNPLKEKQKEEDISSSDQHKETLKRAISASSFVNNTLLSETIKEIGYLNQYLDNKLNRWTLEKKINEILETKNQLSVYLSSEKDSFEKENMISFYQVTEQRLNNSIAISEQILSFLSNPTSRTELINNISSLVKKDVDLKNQQNKEFIHILDSKKIKYTYNKEKEEIQYTID